MRRNRIPLWTVPTAIVAVALLLITTPSTARDRTDIIILANGDRITGEVRQLALGKVTVKTDAMGTVSIEWDQVEKLESSQLFEVENEDGEKHYGFLTPADEEGRFLVLSPAGPVIALKHDRIVRIESLEETWLDRWRGHVDLGFTYTTANNATSVSLGSEATYRSKNFKWETSLSSIVNTRDDVEDTSWNTLTSTYSRFLRDRWYWTGFVKFESNEEVQLDLRSTLGGGIGRYVVQTNRSQLGLVGGLAGNRELYSDAEADAWTLEAVLNTAYEFFVFGDHDTRLSASLTVLPSLSDWGRYRAELNTTLRREFFNDFTISLTIVDSYDSDPPAGDDAEKNDLRVQTTLGWTF